MSEATTKAPWHLWAVGLITLVWNGVGIFSYSMTHLGKLESLGMTPDQIAYFDTFPTWANALWAMGVWGAFLGSILLLMRSRWAVTSLVISIIGLIGTTIYQQIMIDIPADLDNPALVIMIWVITIFMLIYAVRMRGAGVLQ